MDIHTFLNLALAIHVFSHFFACTIRSPLCTVRNSCEILKNGFLFMYTKGRLLVIFLVWCTQLSTACTSVIQKILFKGAVQKGERERKKLSVHCKSCEQMETSRQLPDFFHAPFSAGHMSYDAILCLSLFTCRISS